jgi:hypothetical protein
MIDYVVYIYMYNLAARRWKKYTKRENYFFCNPILFAICTNTFNKLCKQRLQWHVEECSVAFLCNW